MDLLLTLSDKRLVQPSLTNTNTSIESVLQEQRVFEPPASFSAKAGISSLDAYRAMADAAKKFNVYGNHAYAPESVDLEKRTVSLTNPWGKKHVVEMPIEEFMKYYTSVQVGSSLAHVGQDAPNRGPKPTTLIGNAGNIPETIQELAVDGESEHTLLDSTTRNKQGRQESDKTTVKIESGKLSSG